MTNADARHDAQKRAKVSDMRTHASRLRPYRVENTASRLICQVKQRWARLVLGLETAWESRVLQAFILRLLFAFRMSRLSCENSLNFCVHCKNVHTHTHYAFILHPENNQISERDVRREVREKRLSSPHTGYSNSSARLRRTRRWRGQSAVSASV